MSTEIDTDTVRLDPWDADATAGLRVTGGTIDDVLVAGLNAILRVARGETPVSDVPPSDSSSVSVPIRGQGAGYGDTFTELAGDLLAQLDANGTGLVRVRLDGVLATDEGGYSAWGYALGEADGPAPAVDLNLVGPARVAQEGDRTTLTCRLRRS